MTKKRIKYTETSDLSLSELQDSIDNVIKHLQDIQINIKAKYIDTNPKARIEMDIGCSRCDYCFSGPSYSIVVTRDETDNEYKQRLAKEQKKTIKNKTKVKK
jgi:hypothetical protein